MMPPAPEIRILKVVRDIIAGVDFEALTGVAGMKARHTRNRYPTKTEKPCTSVRWLGNTDVAVNAQYRNVDERVKECHIDLEYDLPLDPENSNDDPTGWDKLSLVNAAAFAALRAEDSPLSLISDDVIQADTKPDEASTADEGRLVQAIIVVYRTLTDQPNVLLARGEDG